MLLIQKKWLGQAQNWLGLLAHTLRQSHNKIG
ncbi:MAG: hypothetical protein ACI86C_001811 [Candidatus Latescibacterota bacterium]